MKRVTIMLQDELDRKLRHIQADLIRKTGNGHSFSKVINDTVKRGLKK